MLNLVKASILTTEQDIVLYLTNLSAYSETSHQCPCPLAHSHIKDHVNMVNDTLVFVHDPMAYYDIISNTRCGKRMFITNLVEYVPNQSFQIFILFFSYIFHGHCYNDRLYLLFIFMVRFCLRIVQFSLNLVSRPSRNQFC